MIIINTKIAERFELPQTVLDFFKLVIIAYF